MASFALRRLAGDLKKGCHRGEYANVLLAAKGLCVCSAPQAPLCGILLVYYLYDLLPLTDWYGLKGSWSVPRA